MFSDRLWIVKLVAVLGLLSWLGHDARRAFLELSPDVERVALNPEGHQEQMIHLWAQRVKQVSPSGFEISTKVGPMWILTPAPPPVGEHVSILAHPVLPRTLQAVALQVNHGYGWKRPLNYALSVLTVLVYLWLVRRRFHWRIEQGLFRSRY
jgi:hypothetical protein